MSTIDELIIRQLQGRATRDDEMRVHTWRQERPDNEQHYQELAAVWSLLGTAAPDVGATQPPAVADVIGRAEADRLLVHPSARPTSRLRKSVARAAMLAAASVAVGFGLAMMLEGPDEAALLANSEVATGAGEMTTIMLGDGSNIRLGSLSRLRLGMEGETRVVELEGRAFFGVKSDHSRQFIVRTRFGDAVALGTRFEVRSEDEEFRVLVVDGRVRVKAGGAEAQLTGGEMSRSPAGAPPITSRVADVYAQLDWMGNALVFQSTPLERAVREVEHRFGVPIVLTDPSLGDLTVTATFTDQNLESVMLVLCEIVGSRCTVTPEMVRMSRQNSRGGR